MPHAFLAASLLLLGACSYPKATVVAPPKKANAATSQQARETRTTTNGRGPALGLRSPDVVSELPDAGTSSRTPVSPPSSEGSAGTVIARPPTP